MLRSILVPLLVGAALAGCDGPGSSSINYQTEWGVGWAQAQQEKKLVLLNFGGPW